MRTNELLKMYGQPIDLTSDEVQGCYGNDKVEALNKPGFYRINVRDYTNEGKYFNARDEKWEEYAKKENFPKNEYGNYKLWDMDEATKALYDKIDAKIDADMKTEGLSDHAKVLVYVDKVVLSRSDSMQIIHIEKSDRPDLFEDKWAYYNGNEQLFKGAICTEEVIDEFPSYEEAVEVIGDVCKVPSKEEFEAGLCYDEEDDEEGEEDNEEEYIKYNNIIIALENLTKDELQEVIVDEGQNVSQKIFDYFQYPVNGSNCAEACVSIAKDLLAGKSIKDLRKEIGNDNI